MLKFKENGKFGILLFGDLHVGTDYADSQRFRDMHKLMTAALDEYKPDLCVLLGDITTTSKVKEDPDGYADALKAICGPITSRNIPVAAIMGNHEHDHDCDREILDIFSELEGITMRSEGVKEKADYKELIYSSDGKTPLACLWFLDSNNLYETDDTSVYDFVHTDQIKWFEEESEKLKKLNGGKPMPSYIFQHIPVPEEYRLLRKAKFFEIPYSTRGFNTHEGTRYVGADGTQGYVGEGPCSPDINNGQFESWKRVGGVAGAFFGHDHLNDFSGYVDNIFLAQHKTAGFGAYTDGCRSCVRYVEIDEKNPLSFTHELKHFKEFGLKCECLGPIFKRITDRQSTNMHIASKVVCGIAAAGAVIYGASKLIRR